MQIVHGGFPNRELSTFCHGHGYNKHTYTQPYSKWTWIQHTHKLIVNGCNGVTGPLIDGLWSIDPVT
jgi:hypothetical protein